MQKNIEDPPLSEGVGSLQTSEEINENFESHPFKEEWLVEIRRRREEYLRGEGTSIPAEQVMARARERIAEFRRTGA